MADPDNNTYSQRFVRFVLVPWHAEEYMAAYLDQSSSSRSVLLRLHREYVTLPPRHSCSCRCPQLERGFAPCSACLRLHRSSVVDDIPAELGRSSVPDSTVPMTLALDLACAMKALGGPLSAISAIAMYLSRPEAA